MTKSLAAFTFLAPDYDSAIEWFRDALGFALLSDTPMGPGKRWVVVAPPGGAGARVVIAEASDEGSAPRSAQPPGDASAISWRPTTSLAITRQWRRAACPFSKRRVTKPMGSSPSSPTPGAANGICCSPQDRARALPSEP